MTRSDFAGAGGAVALIHPGLEPALKEELRELGIAATLEAGGVAFPSSWENLGRVHEGSWLAGRVLVRAGRVRATNLDELAAGVRRLDWTGLVHPRQPIEVELSAQQTRLWRAEVVGRKVERAITDALRGPRVEGPRAPWQPVTIHVRIDGDQAMLSVDASGERLHRRGWREATAKAPLRENLAAAVLRLAGWDLKEPLVDAMCGSGTFILEGARRAAGLTPRLTSAYAWHRFPAAPRPRASSARPRPTGLLLGSDRDAGAIKASMGNAGRAGVAQRVRWLQEPFDELQPPAPAGLLVVNAPYGHRVGEGSTPPWERWGDLLHGRWIGWRFAWLLSAATDPRKIGGAAVVRFENGGIPVHLVCGGGRRDPGT